MTEIEVGTVVPCLVACWFSLHEATAERRPNGWWVTVIMARGKGGKELYPVSKFFEQECDSFVLL